MVALGPTVTEVRVGSTKKPLQPGPKAHRSATTKMPASLGFCFIFSMLPFRQDSRYQQSWLSIVAERISHGFDEKVAKSSTTNSERNHRPNLRKSITPVAASHQKCQYYEFAVA